MQLKSLKVELTRRARLQYLGIPLAAGAVTRAVVLKLLRPTARARFFALFGQLGMIGLLYVIIVLFANQVRARCPA